MGQYVLSILALSMICGVLLSLFREGTVRRLLRMICGIALMTAVLSPLGTISLPDIPGFSDFSLSAGEQIANRGTAMAEQEKEMFIRQALEAYILDKATALNADILPTVTLNEQGIPVEAALRGQWDAAARERLAEIITNDLGIPEVDQQWTEQTCSRP